MHMHSFLDMWWSLIKSVQTTSQASSGIYLYQSILVMEFQTLILKYTQFSFHGYWDYKDHKLIILLCSMKTVWLFTFKTRWHPFFNYGEFINFCRCQFKAMVRPSLPAMQYMLDRILQQSAVLWHRKVFDCYPIYEMRQRN